MVSCYKQNLAFPLSICYSGARTQLGIKGNFHNNFLFNYVSLCFFFRIKRVSALKTQTNLFCEPEVSSLYFEHQHLGDLHKKCRKNTAPQGNLDRKLLMC